MPHARLSDTFPMTENARPLLAITMGDPAGIGPEIVLKALAHADGAGRGLAWADS